MADTIVDNLIIKLGLDPAGVRKGLEDAKKDADKADQHFEQLGSKWGRGLMGIASRLAAPVLGAFSIGKMISSYTSSVAQVAQMTGRYSAKLDEWRLKRAALQRVTREDLDLYVKTRKALTGFQIAMADLSAKIVRLFSPAIRQAVEWLNKLSDWVSNNSHNIIRFLTVVAGILTALLIPAIIRMGRAMLANPITWIIALLVALAVAIDDLIVYMRGGESQFAQFWALFGTGAEISEKLAALWEWLKETGAALLPYLIKIGIVIGSWKALTAIFAGLKAAFGGLIGIVVKLFSVLRAHPFLLLLTAIYMWYDRFDEICDGARALWEDLSGFIARKFRETVQGAQDLWNDFVDLLKSLWEGAVNWLARKIEAFVGAVNAAVEAVKNAFRAVIDAIKAMWDGMISAVAGKIAALADKVSGVYHGLKQAVGLETSEEERKKLTQSFYSPEEQARLKAEGAARRQTQAAINRAGAVFRQNVPAPGTGAAHRGGAAGAAGGTVNNNNQTINVNGAGDPEQVAQRVVALESSGGAGGGITYPADTGIIQ